MHMSEEDKHHMYIVLLISFFMLVMFTTVMLCMKMHKKRVMGCGEGCRGRCKMTENAKRLKDLDVVLVKMEGCIHCKRLKELLDKNNVSNLLTIVDSESPEVNGLRDKYGPIDGFPIMISILTGKKLMGGRGKIEDIIEELS